jgi:hypothetical protein
LAGMHTSAECQAGGSSYHRDLERIFRYRQQIIERLFDDTKPQTSTRSC